MEGRDPLSGEQLIEPHRARRINAIMMLCGHYDNSGEFAFRVGLPGKSGVGGGILCIAPGQGSIAVCCRIRLTPQVANRVSSGRALSLLTRLTSSSAPISPAPISATNIATMMQIGRAHV